MEVLNTTFTRGKNLVNRPLSIDYTDGGGSQRIEPLAIFLIDETRLENDNLAKMQVENYVNSRKIRIIETGLKI